MGKAFSLLFIFSLVLCSAQQPVITKLDKQEVVGKLIGLKNRSEFTNIKVKKNKRYRRHEFVYNGRLELSKGKWQIKNDTLILTERFFKQKQYNDNHTYFFTFRKKEKRSNISKLILYKGQWMEIEDGKYIARLVLDQYIRTGMTWKHKEWVQRID